MSSFERELEPSSQENKHPNTQYSLEDGEIRILDENNYILSDSVFKFGFDHNRKINWRNVSKADLRALLGGEDLSDVLLNLEDIAYCDLKTEKNCAWISNEGQDAMKVMQAGMQYLIFAQKQMLKKIGVLQDYTQKQVTQAQKLEQIQNQQKSKMRKYRRMNEKLNEQAIHFEIMINKLRPDLLNDRMKKMIAQPNEVLESRTDVRLMGGNQPHEVVSDILKEKGVLKEGHKSIFDYFQGKETLELLDGKEKEDQHSSFNDRKDESKETEGKEVEADQKVTEENKGTLEDQQNHLLQIMEQLQMINEKLAQHEEKERRGSKKSGQKEEGQKMGGKTQVMRSLSLGDELEESVGSSRSSKSKRSQKKVDRIQQQVTGSNGQWRGNTPIQEEDIEEDVQEDSKIHPDKTLTQSYLKQNTSVMGEEVEVDEEFAASSNPTNSKNYLEVAHNVAQEEQKFEEPEIEEIRDLGKAISIEDLSSQLEKDNKKDELARFKSAQYNVDHLQEIQRLESNKSEEIKENMEEDDEYRDDFEAYSQASETGNDPQISTSGLPPKSNKGQPKAPALDGSQKKFLPQEMYNLNLAESQMSIIDFELSVESRGLQGSIGGLSKKGSVIQNLMKKNLDEYESGEYWDSNDFEVSDSNFSQSYRSKGGNPQAKPKKQTTGASGAGKQQFYQYEQKKFSSYDKPEFNLQDADFD